MFEGDIKINQYKETVVENGDLVITTDDMSYIFNTFNSMSGSWKYDRNFGLDLTQFFGELDDVSISNNIRKHIKDYFASYDMDPIVNIYKNANYTLSIFINLYSLLDSPYDIYILFNDNEKKLEFIMNNENNQKSNSIISGNKYQKRREVK